MSDVCAGSLCAAMQEKTSRHPCYAADAQHKYARIHLPVAPRCNIQCNYCNRKFDCVNESRPGVTSEVLTPELAKDKFIWVKEKIENLSVVGIAGPGDALADWPLTKATIEAIQAVDSDIIFCLSTNGLLLPDYAPDIVALGLRHVTVTVNTLDAKIGAKIYKFVSYRGQTYVGVAAANLLLANQLEGIEYLVKHGVLVKINIVMIKGLNADGIPAVVKKVKELGVFVTNIMPLIPAPGAAFEQRPQTSMKELNALRNICELDIRQMRHCQQCRADAVGLLKEDRSQEFRMCNSVPACAATKSLTPRIYRIAVTTKHGNLVDQHFGHASQFHIYQGAGREFQLFETRQVEQYCTGMAECDGETEQRRDKIVETLQDCDAILTMRIGYHAKEVFRASGIHIEEYCDTVESGLQYAAGKVAELPLRPASGYK